MLGKRKALILTGISSLIAVCLMFIPVKALTIMHSDQLLYAFYLKDHAFSVQWEHSVEKEAWVEYFRVHDNVIYLESTKFKTFGAGVPSESEHRTVLKDGWVHMAIDRKIGYELVIRSNQMNDYQLQFGKDSYVLNPSDTAYRVTVKGMPLITILVTQLKRIVR
ncbi:hypothetical protein SAMN04488072_107144 [Lentibacillus halodurans]|uniref:DUF1850 domain-containing protein n=1 Tax=Lentibacillus halodurans TaxID=237679 RepID=A0A1I0YFA6_9BACI|nr:DUF1850 domain-containing protein [Lentibacillus halodurans]SFB12095.1 hypothetical protein SAMN04488072_107144 [Lentibacillus halodurans]